MHDTQLVFAREKAQHNFSGLTDTELLSLLLASSQLAERLLTHYPTLVELSSAALPDLINIPGVGEALALRLKATFTIAQRLSQLHIHLRPQIRRPSDIIPLVQPLLQQLPQEHLLVVLLDSNNHLIDIITVYVGSLDTTVVRNAELFRPAIQRNSAGIIIVHNHPSGNATPSPADTAFTEALIEAGKVLDIAVLDHLIIGKGEWVSMREQGLGFSPPK